MFIELHNLYHTGQWYQMHCCMFKELHKLYHNWQRCITTHETLLKYKLKWISRVWLQVSFKHRYITGASRYTWPVIGLSINTRFRRFSNICDKTAQNTGKPYYSTAIVCKIPDLTTHGLPMGEETAFSIEMGVGFDQSFHVAHVLSPWEPRDLKNLHFDPTK